MLVISDLRVIEKRTIECHEEFLDFRDTVPEILVDLSRNQIESRSEAFLKVRRTVLEKLLTASKELPEGVKFLIKEAYRPPGLQQKFFDSYYETLGKQFPGTSSEELRKETSKYVAPVLTAPHPAGGAVDLTLVKSSGVELDMGSRFNAPPFETNNACYTFAENISKQAKVNRRILISSLTDVGFVNYPTEWWHWSYGDKFGQWLRKRRTQSMVP